MAGVLRQIRKLNGFSAMPMVEPYAGGGGASLKLLLAEETQSVHLNDADPAIHALWSSMLYHTAEFVQLLDRTEVSITEWTRQREIYRQDRNKASIALGFATFYLNRCNRSGIIRNGGPIGGLAQQGLWKIDARFNRVALRERCIRISEYGERVAISSLDGLTLLKEAPSQRSFYFIDPPYYHKGGSLYLNALDGDYHQRLAETLRRLDGHAWVLTYDDCPEVRGFYEGWAAVRPFSLRYVAAERRHGRELLITHPDVVLPERQDSMAIGW